MKNIEDDNLYEVYDSIGVKNVDEIQATFKTQKERFNAAIALRQVLALERIAYNLNRRN